MSAEILIVDDAPNIVLSLEFLFKKEGFNVRSASDGEEALRAMEEKVPDVILLDVMMPKRNGFEVCEAIRANPQWREVRIVMLTAKGREMEQEKGMALGADDYITKPFSTRGLVSKVRGLLGLRTE
ncbi:MAG: response regulator [Magnetococcus sp. MYC-9]